MPPKARATTKLSSHTVLVIDKSGSMRNVDVTIGLGQNVSRNTALFDCLQGQFFPQQEANDHDASDVYSMIVFSDEARVAYLHEPLSSAKEKTISAAVDRPESHGYYLPTLKSLGQVLDLPLSLTAAATMVLFLSDGKPSDALPRGKEDATTKLTGFIVRPALAAMGRSLDSANQGKSIFSFHSMGFGPLTEFGVLKSMAESIPNGMGTFHVAALNIRDLRRTLSSFSSSITESRLSSKQIGPARPLREVKMIPKYQTSAVSYQFYEGVTVYDPPVRLEAFNWVIRGTFDVSVSKEAFGKGGERYAFYLKFEDGKNIGTWVAKEDKYISADQEEEVKFHEQKLVSQKYAQTMAAEFTSILARLVPRYTLTFSACYLVKTNTKPNRFLFVEPFIQGEFVKWNSNSGYVKTNAGLGAICEDEDEENEDEDDDDSIYDFRGFSKEDVPQAFSHWSHVHGVSILKVGELIICDLQGFYEASSKTFRLVDPVIHSASEGMRFARTDHGKKGIAKFFETHQCNGLCLMLSLPPVPLCYQAGSGTQTSPQRPIAVVTQSSTTIPTSEVPLQKTPHLAKRQEERAIVTKELKRAVKRGSKTPQVDGRVKHEHGGVVYVTDKTGHVGITGFRKGV